MGDKATTRQRLVFAEGLCALLCLGALTLAAALYALAPVGGGEPAARAEAPWLFLGLQELLRLLPAWLAGLAIPAGALALLAALPWLSRRAAPQPPSLRRAFSWAELPAFLILAAWAGLTIMGAL